MFFNKSAEGERTIGPERRPIEFFIQMIDRVRSPRQRIGST